MKTHLTVKILIITCAVIFAFNSVAAAQPSDPPERVIIFIIDGLRWDAPRRVGMENLLRLAEDGAYAEKSHLIVPYHPTSGAYGELYTTSFPNPVRLAGTLFLGVETQMNSEHSENIVAQALPPVRRLFQEQFPYYATAHGTNSTAYASLDSGFGHTFMSREATDAELVEWAIQLLDGEGPPIRFLRLHLMDVGHAGSNATIADLSAPYYLNIWGEGSPYIQKARTADRLLGRLVEHLKETGLWDSTLLVVTSDHGEADVGWHPITDPDSRMVPLVFAGAGVAEGVRLGYTEQRDIIPTVATMMGVEIPNPGPGSGQVLKAVWTGEPPPEGTRREQVRRLNEQIVAHRRLEARMRLLGREHPVLIRTLMRLENEFLTKEAFYGIGRFLDWHEAGSVEHLLDVNRRILQIMRQALRQFKNRGVK